MNQAVMLINCYLYGATAVMLLVLVLIVYLRGQMNHFPNPFAKKNLVYRHPAQAKGILFGKKFGLLAYSPEQDEGHILVMGPSGTGKTSALLIPTLRSWQGTALVEGFMNGLLSAAANWFGPDTVLHMATSSITPPASVSDGSAAIAIIGGADGPTAIFVTSFYDAQALWGLAVKVFSNVVVVVLNYVFSKLIVFKRK